MKKYVSLFLLMQATFSFAQNGIGSYFDYSNAFYVFDKGIDRQLERDRVSDIRSGNDYIVYTDSKRSFVNYYDGQKQVLEENLPTKITAGPNFVVYQMNQRLMLCEKGEKKLLARSADSFIVGDSIVIWQALPSMAFMSYENGEIKTIIPASNANTFIDQKAGSNIWAFSDGNNMLKVYYKDSVYDSQTRPGSYACGHNIVAFTDIFKNTFSVFYDGEFKVISNEIIKEFMVANDMVAYIDAQENFFIYYKGGITKIDSRRPDYYHTQGNILYFSLNHKLKIIFQGKIFSEPQLIEQSSIICSDNAMLYYNNINQPKYFHKGKVNESFYVQKPYKMELVRDLPVFRYGTTIGFLFNDKIQEFGTRTN